MPIEMLTGPVDRLRVIHGVGTMFYGRARRVELTGTERLSVEQAGYLPVRYQAVRWFVVLFALVVPLGTYEVLKKSWSHFFDDGFVL